MNDYQQYKYPIICTDWHILSIYGVDLPIYMFKHAQLYWGGAC